jgi:hypothetical protein
MGLNFEQPEKTNWVYFARYELNTIFGGNLDAFKQKVKQFAKLY